MTEQLVQTAARLRGIPLKLSPEKVPTVTLAGEIFVRRDALSRQYLTERLAQKGFATVCSPIAEWVLYCNYMVDRGLNPDSLSLLQKIKLKIRNKFMAHDEKPFVGLFPRGVEEGAAGFTRNLIEAIAQRGQEPCCERIDDPDLDAGLAEPRRHTAQTGFEPMLGRPPYQQSRPIGRVTLEGYLHRIGGGQGLDQLCLRDARAAE